MASLQNFFSKIYPPDGDGFRCAVSLSKDGKPRQFFFKTNAELAEKLREIDLGGSAAYHACAVFDTDKNRKQENALAMKSLWLDIDAGEGKPYADANEAYAALNQFVAASGLPKPLTVCSGNGLHAYFLLSAPVEPGKWTVMANNLEILCGQHGLKVDKTRTTDSASILRPPGTYNRKNPTDPLEVYVVDWGEGGAGIELMLCPPPKADGLPVLSLGDMPKTRPSMTQGYPDGERTDALTSRAGWCVGPLHMSLEEATKACLEWNAHNTPPLPEDKVEKTVANIYERNKAQLPAPSVALPPETARPWLPPGFCWSDAMEIMMRVRDPESEPEEKKFINAVLCNDPFYIETFREDESTGEHGEGSVRICCRLRHTGWRSFTISRRALYGQNWLSELSAHNICCEPGQEKALKHLLHSLIKRATNMAVPDTSFRSFGWKNDMTAFACGHSLYTKGGVRRISGTKEYENIAHLLAPNPKGSFLGWRQAVRKLFSPGCEAQGIAVLAALASPLMPLVFDESEGGAILSLVSYESGRGKTTAMKGAESVWGMKNCLRLSDTSSMVAKFRNFGIRQNLPVMVDEYCDGDAEHMAAFIKQFTGGIDKDRLGRSGEARSDRLEWKLVHIGTSNTFVTETLKAANFHPQAMRIFEIVVDLPDNIVLSNTNEVMDELALNAGYAGPCFLRHIMANYGLDKLKIAANHLVGHFTSVLGTKDTDVRYMLRLVAVMALVAKIVSAPNLVDGEPMIELNPDRMVKFMLNAIKKNLEDRRFTFIDHIQHFLRTHVYGMVVVKDSYIPNTPAILISRPKREEVLGRYETEPRRLYLANDVMRKYCASARVPYKEMASKLEKEGVLLNRNKIVQLGAGVHEITPVRVPCWDLDMGHEKLKAVGEVMLSDIHVSSSDELANKVATRPKRLKLNP